MNLENSVSSLEATLRKLNSIDIHFVYTGAVFANFFNHKVENLSDEMKLNEIISALKSGFNHTMPTIILNILNQRESAKIEQTETEWIDIKNERLCVFLWLSLQKTHTPYETTIFPIQQSDYQSHLMPMRPPSAAACLKLFLDFFYVFSAPMHIKIQRLRELRNKWEQVNKFKHKMLKVLEQDNDQVTQWFWEYSKRFQGNLLNIYIDFYTFRDKLNLVQAICDGLNLADADKTLALNKAYSAFHAKKFKEKPKNLKGANFWLGPEQIRMLNEIAWRKKLSEKDALYSLVNDAYLKIIK